MILDSKDQEQAHFQIFIKPENTRPEENFCWVILEIEYSPDYPRTMPKVLNLMTDISMFNDSEIHDSILKKGKAVSELDLGEMNLEVQRLAKYLI